jgi:hypothetical protein
MSAASRQLELVAVAVQQGQEVSPCGCGVLIERSLCDLAQPEANACQLVTGPRRQTKVSFKIMLLKQHNAFGVVEQTNAEGIQGDDIESRGYVGVSHYQSPMGWWWLGRASI